MQDRDFVSRPSFDVAFESTGTEVEVSDYQSPNTNAFAERFIQTLRQECLDHFVVFGEQNMDYLVMEFVADYHQERSHQGMENALLQSGSNAQADVVSMDSSHRCERLGGVLKLCYRQAD